MKRNQPPKAGTKPRDGAQQRSVLKQIDELNRMSMEQLRKRWVDLFGADPGRFGRNFLIRRLAYRIQELVYGGLSTRSPAEAGRDRLPTRDEAKSKEPAANARPQACRRERDCCGTGMVNGTR